MLTLRQHHSYAVSKKGGCHPRSRQLSILIIVIYIIHYILSSMERQPRLLLHECPSHCLQWLTAFATTSCTSRANHCWVNTRRTCIACRSPGSCSRAPGSWTGVLKPQRLWGASPAIRMLLLHSIARESSPTPTPVACRAHHPAKHTVVLCSSALSTHLQRLRDAQRVELARRALCRVPLVQ